MIRRLDEVGDTHETPPQFPPDQPAALEADRANAIAMVLRQIELSETYDEYIPNECTMARNED